MPVLQIPEHQEESATGESQKNFGPPYLFLQLLKLATEKLGQKTYFWTTE